MTGLIGGPARQLHWAPTLRGTKDVTQIFRNMVRVNSGFHMQKNFSENYSQFWHMTSNR